jgi:hypothetical protein
MKVLMLVNLFDENVMRVALYKKSINDSLNHIRN